ncbi:4Fe-4S binding protein [bacterium]|nr:4Fe-4S binding protein [bacterium]
MAKGLALFIIRYRCFEKDYVRRRLTCRSGRSSKDRHNSHSALILNWIYTSLMRKSLLPTVDPMTCLSTGWCVHVCPTECLDFWNDLPSVKYPDRCTSCGACVVVCPTEAMRIQGFEPVGRARSDPSDSNGISTNKAT